MFDLRLLGAGKGGVGRSCCVSSGSLAVHVATSHCILGAGPRLGGVLWGGGPGGSVPGEFESLGLASPLSPWPLYALLR